MKNRENFGTAKNRELSRREVLVGGAGVAVGMGLPTLAFAKKNIKCERFGAA
jgi:hypothetical protein